MMMDQEISTDSDDINLTIDLDPEYNNQKQVYDDQRNKKGDDHCDQPSDEDSLSIGCNEDELSVNFFIKPKPKPGNIQASIKSKALITKRKSEDISDNTNNMQVKKKTLELNYLENYKITIPGQCFLCSFRGDNGAMLYNHLSKEHEQDHNRCLLFKTCPYIFCPLYKHAEFHGLSLLEEVFSCLKCSFETTTQRKLRHHVQIDCVFRKPIAAKVFVCGLCPVLSKTYLTMIGHFKQVHAIHNEHLKNIVMCPLCKVQTRESRFSAHLKHHVIYHKDQNKVSINVKVKLRKKRDEKGTPR